MRLQDLGLLLCDADTVPLLHALPILSTVLNRIDDLYPECWFWRVRVGKSWKIKKINFGEIHVFPEKYDFPEIQ